MKRAGSPVKVRLRKRPKPGVRAAILKPLVAHTRDTVGDIPPATPFAVTIDDPETGAVLGGLWATIWADWLYIDLLALPKETRGGGLGSRLMEIAEQEAVRRGCIGAYLNTFDFQAKPFYEKLGYRVFGAIPNAIGRHKRHFLYKRFR